MVQVVRQPTVIQAEGTAPKLIQEFVGNVTTGTKAVSVARMKASAGWEEPGQTPEFDEYTLVLGGTLHVETREGVTKVGANQAVIAKAGEWIRYSAPDGAEYVAVCLPAFHPDTVHRD
jgi:quercetin dioxygenase-like cupin family protein